MHLETNLNKIKVLGEQKLKENYKFRTYVKNLDVEIEELDMYVHKINDQITRQIDCTECANCCKTISPVLDEEDVNKFARGLKIHPKELINNFCIRDDEEPDKYQFKNVPCPFLQDNKCSNYDYRPKDCQSYPHLQNDKVIFRLWGIIDNYSICPIVFNAFEILKADLWNRYWRRNIED